MAGRPRKPTAVKKAQGTLQKCRTPKNEPQFEAIINLQEPEIPLDDIGRDFYYRVGAMLIRQGVLTEADQKKYELMCRSYAILIKLEDELNKNLFKNIEGKNGGRSALAHQYNAQIQTVIKLMESFGLDPASRSRLGVAPKKTETEEAKIMKELIGIK